MTRTDTPVTILIGALGGEGGGVLAQWLVEAATSAGYPAQSTSIPGVAQRTGATTYYVEVFPRTRAALGGREPVLSLLPVPGALDLVVASEPLEAARIVSNGMASRERTTLVASTRRALTTAEKMVPGDGRFDPELLLEVARRHSARLAAFDMQAAAAQAGTVVSAVMFGAVAGSGVLPFGRETCEAAIGSEGPGAQASRAGFALGFAAVQAAATTATGGAAPSAKAVPGLAEFPPAVREFVALGNARLVEFQDPAYADLYRARVTRVLEAERGIDPTAAHGFALARETARFLALWMAFDDVVRVASLKCRASRFARVRREVGAGNGDVVRIVDHFKPGIPEMAGLMPPWLAHHLTTWDRRRVAKGKAPLAFALHLKTDTVAGFLALRMLAGCRGLRRRGTRYAQEQAAIERWLAAIVHAAREDWSVAHEFALCGRLVKGYGATNERAKHNLAHIVAQLAEGGTFAGHEARAAAIRDAREAALADEGGRALDQTLAKYGAPARPVVAQPIRWTRRPAATTRSARTG
jgi:indolepyruvate ferredoxin oxidoreductase beta subunit